MCSIKIKRKDIKGTMNRKLLGDNKTERNRRGISNLKRFNIIKRLLVEEIVLLYLGLFNTIFGFIKRSDKDWDDEDNSGILVEVEEFDILYIV